MGRRGPKSLPGVAKQGSWSLIGESVSFAADHPLSYGFEFQDWLHSNRRNKPPSREICVPVTSNNPLPPMKYSTPIRLRQRLGVAAVLWIAFLTNPAFAWDGAVAGKITVLDTTGGSNFGFRVALAGAPVMCAGGPTWAYLNDTDSNYKVYVAQLMVAKLASNPLVIYTTNVGGYCQIGYITVGS
jgi:hypothetical protein